MVSVMFKDQLTPWISFTLFIKTISLCVIPKIKSEMFLFLFSKIN